jgi:hypothetical protein
VTTLWLRCGNGERKMDKKCFGGVEQNEAEERRTVHRRKEEQGRSIYPD